MKPISLKVQAFGPFLEKQTIDFAALEESGVFLIDGDTGAGKTSVLDAICFALYDAPSGGERGSFYDMRCKSAGDKTETFVEFEFSAGGSLYRFRRAVTASGKLSQSCERMENNVFTSMHSNPTKTAVNAAAEEIIGLDKEQFRKVIILPQGQSEKLLTCDSDEKEKVLNKLFLTSRWENIVAKVREKVDAQERALEQMQNDIVSALESNGCAAIEELETLRNSQLAEYKLTAEECGKLRESSKKAAEMYSESEVLASRFANLDKLKETLDILSAEMDSRKDEEETLLRAKAALEIEPFRTALASRSNALSSAKKAFAAAETTFSTSSKRLTEKQAEIQTHEEKSEDNRLSTERIILLNSRRALYEELPLLTERERSANKALTKAEKKMDSAKVSYEAKKADWERANEEQVEISTRKNAAYEQYRVGICASLAQKLVNGAACPVCGSTNHPSPAVSDSKPVSEEEINELNKLLKAADEKIELAEKAKESAESAFRDSETELSAARTEHTKAKTALEEKEKERLAGVDSLEQLNSEYEKLSGEVEEYKKLTDMLREELNSASSAVESANALLGKAKAELESAQEEYDTAAESWSEKLSANGFSSEEDYLSAYITRDEYNARIEKQKTLEGRYNGAKDSFDSANRELAEIARPDVGQLKAKSEQLAQDLAEMNRKSGILEKECESLEKSLAALKAKRSEYIKEKEKADANRLFCNLISAHGKGTSLPRFVLSSMLNAVVDRANVMLEKIMSGRYKLYRTDETTSGKKKSGLELAIIDSLNGGTRSVKSLSGGEKFLVSLCFAIAVSAIVQEQGKGVSMDAMFVDEGFGTLDKDCTEDALRILAEVSETHALVGVISHVDALSDSIASKIDIIKNDRTGISTIRQ